MYGGVPDPAVIVILPLLLPLHNAGLTETLLITGNGVTVISAPPIKPETRLHPWLSVIEVKLNVLVADGLTVAVLPLLTPVAVYMLMPSV